MDNEQLKKMENNPSDPEKESSLQPGNNAAESTETTPSRKPGAILAARRVAAGISEEQVASRLKMSIRQVRFLEADDYDALHGMATARGFVRAYARILQIDPEPLVATFAQKEKAPASAASISRSKPAEPFVRNREPFRKKRGTSGKIAILLIIVVGVLVVASNMNFFSFMNKFKKEPVKKTTPVVAPAPPAASVTGTKEAVPAAGQATPENRPAGQTAAIPSGQTNQANAPVPVPATRNASVTPTQAPAAKGSLLVVNFREKSWLQVQKKDGSVIAEYIGKPGEKRQLEVTEPVTVIVGFAPGVTMDFRGAPVDLVSNTSSSVAKVSLK